MAIGDSLTAGVFLGPDETWPARLASLLGNPVINAGIPGQTSAQGLARFEWDVLAHQPDNVIIAFGMNDHTLRAAGRHSVEKEAFVTSLEAMVRLARGVGAAVYLCLLHHIIEPYYFDRHPREWYPRGAAAEIDEYNECIRRVSESMGAPLVDIPAAFGRRDTAYTTESSALLRTVSNSGARDGVHLTAAGAQLYAETVVQTMTQAGGLGAGQQGWQAVASTANSRSPRCRARSAWDGVFCTIVAGLGWRILRHPESR